LANHQSRPTGAPSPVRRIYSSLSWIEARAEDQLAHVATLDGVKMVAGFPDLHPGKYGPVGCAVLSSRLHPRLISSDIGCGMSLFALDMSSRKLKIDKAARRLRELQEPYREDVGARLLAAGLPEDLEPGSLGSIGGGNHFCELQTLSECGPEAEALGLSEGSLMLLIHSGSRSLGMNIFSTVFDHPTEGLDPESLEARDYLSAHDQAVAWASLNRQIIAERAADALRCEVRLVTDSPHNLVEMTEGGILHRKGAARARAGYPTPLAGSRETDSHLLMADEAVATALHSLAHGAGRKYDRSSMHGRVQGRKSDLVAMAQPGPNQRVICDDKDLMIEEAGTAYKDVDRVLADLEREGLAHSIARLSPIITFKKAADHDHSDARGRKNNHGR